MSWPDSTIIVPVSVCHRGSYAETYSRFIQRKVLTPNDFTDLEAIRLRLAFYEELSNQSPTPFRWKFDRTQLTTLLSKIEARHMALADVQCNYQEAAA